MPTSVRIDEVKHSSSEFHTQNEIICSVADDPDEGTVCFRARFDVALACYLTEHGIIARDTALFRALDTFAQVDNNDQLDALVGKEFHE